MTDEPYTRVPNALLELLATLPDAECRVMLVVIRKTAGWQKQCDVISYTQLEASTGMSRQGVINGVNAAIARGILRRVASGKNNGYCYEVVNEVDQVKQSTNLTTSSQRSRPLDSVSSQRSRPQVVNEVDHLTPQVVNEVDTQKKDSKEKKEKGTATRKRAARSPRPRDIVFEAVCESCGIDWHVCTTTQRQQANQTVETLRRAAEKHHVDDDGTVDRIRHARRHWKLHDWRGKDGSSPTPAQLREIWGAAMKTYAPPVVTAPIAPAEAPMTPAELAKYLQERNNGRSDTSV